MGGCGTGPFDALEYEEFYQKWKILYHKIQDV